MQDSFPHLRVGREGEVVVCLPGMFGRAEQWLPVMEGLADECTTFCLDLPLDYRQGWLAPEAPTVTGLTDYVAAFLTRQGLGEVVLCGNSLGGQVALDFSRRFPAQVKALVLTGSAGLFERSLASGKFILLDLDFIQQQADLILHRREVLDRAYLQQILE